MYKKTFITGRIPQYLTVFTLLFLDCAYLKADSEDVIHGVANSMTFHEEEYKPTSSQPLAEGEGIFPNEYDTYKWFETVKGKKGTLLSVGTFRTLFLATMGNFENVILLDWDPSVSEFNRKNLKLIQTLGELGLSPKLQRYYYLSIILMRWLPEDEYKALEESQRDERLNLDLLFQKFTTSAVPLMSTFVREELRAFVQSIKKQQLSAIKNIVQLFDPTAVMSPESFLEHLQSRLMIISKYHRRGKFNEFLYWASDENWLKLQEMVKRNQIQVVQGSIFGELSMSSIIDEHHRHGKSLSIFDISNALDYYRHREARRQSREIIDRFFSHLKSMPFTKDAKVLFTVRKYGRDEAIKIQHENLEKKFKNAMDLWDYKSVDPKKLISDPELILGF